MSVPLLHVLAGPNGAGKTTLYDRVLATTRLPYLSADHIAAEQWPGEESVHAYEASRLAAQARDALLERRESFIFETVFSHGSKLELVQEATAHGYQVHLHVVMVPLEVALARVPSRVKHGGHTVPPDKIRGRYERLWPLVAAATTSAHRTIVYDNSTAAHAMRVVATLEQGRTTPTPTWPHWTPTALRDKWPSM